MKILITNPVHPILIEGLQELNCSVVYQPDISLEQTKEIVSEYDGIIINTKIKADASFIERAKRLRFIGRLGSGLDIIDLPAADRAGITVIRAAGANANAVAEHVMGMILMMLNKLKAADAAVRSMSWVRETYRGRELDEMTLGIVGFGHNGSLLAKRMRGFNTRILSYDPYVHISAPNVEQVASLELLCANCDIISFHVPLTKETHHMCNDQFLKSCVHKPMVINTSRGKVVDTSALLQALEDGRISMAGLDVFENEHPKTYSVEEYALYKQLFSRKDVILSPHVAGWTTASYRKISEEILEKVSTLISEG